MSMLKGNYVLKGPEPTAQPDGEGSALEKEYYKAALSKLGGSIAFIMKDRTFLWTGDDAPPEPTGPDEVVRRARLQADRDPQNEK